jgi:hypothetical protein
MHYFVGWDVGGWNCDKNRNSRDALVALSNSSGPLEICGKPFRGNLRKQLNEHKTLEGIVNDACGTEIQRSDNIFIAIDTPLGFPVAIEELINGKFVSDELPQQYSDNPYLYRQTERWLFEHGFSPLSAIKDMIGSQTTKGMHLLRSLDLETSSDRCGVWTDGRVTAIETYPAVCQRKGGSQCFMDLVNSLNVTGHRDVCDAACCAVIAYQFAHNPNALIPPQENTPPSEGWIWLPTETCDAN